MTPSDYDAEVERVGYGELLKDIKDTIRGARVGAALAVNRALIELYWEIGSEILRRERTEGWGSQIIGRLAADLRREFPEMTGLSRANLHYMRAFAEAWPAGADPILQRPVGQLPWGQNISLLTKLPDRTVPELALRRTAAPIAVSRYVTSDMTLTDTPPAELQHALPELPALASELTRTLDAAEEPGHRP